MDFYDSRQDLAAIASAVLTEKDKIFRKKVKLIVNYDFLVYNERIHA